MLGVGLTVGLGPSVSGGVTESVGVLVQVSVGVLAGVLVGVLVGAPSLTKVYSGGQGATELLPHTTPLRKSPQLVT